MAGTIVADNVQAASTSQLVIQNGVASAPPTFADSAGTQIGTLCRAWVNFNGSTAAIRASFNVSSVTRNGTGDYTLNFTTALPDANYSVAGSAGNAGANASIIFGYQTAVPTTSTFRFATGASNTGTSVDYTYTGVAVFR